jgi:hypothetical protein
MEKASARRTVNQRAITVVTGTRPQVPWAKPNTRWNANSCQVASSPPTEASARAATVAPPAMTRRTSTRSTIHPARTPANPAATKKLAVALLASATGKPFSATNAASRTERL